MDLIEFHKHEAPVVKDPVLVEGLPGIGNVGKLAAQQLVDSTGATLWYDILGSDFPPQVTVQPDGVVRLVCNQLWVIPGSPDVVVLTGDHQPLSSQGQHALVEGVLDLIQPLGCSTMYTLGGYGMGANVDEPAVLGAATDLATVKRMTKHGVEFREDEPGGGILGASGLFLGLGARRGMTGVCLMGETTGFMVDPKAARSVLKILEKAIGIPIAMEDLEEKAKEIDRLAQQLHEAEVAAKEPGDLHYIG